MALISIGSAEQYKLIYDWPEDLITEDREILFEEFDIEFQKNLENVRKFTDLASPERCPDELLDLYLMAKGIRIGKDLPGVELSAREKRKLAELIVSLYMQKGTASGIVNIIRLLLGIPSSVLTQYNVNVWKIGLSELGVDTILFPNSVIMGTSRPLYMFDIEVLVAITAEQEANIRILVEYMKPIHTHLNLVIQPSPPIDHWELGYSNIGDTTDLHE